ncbi:MAG: CHAT domain-containing protein [Brevundimonas sp.]|uniref:CHAT domain-containing protein n=1 Tax=Brevundimonas sp. TaxID=1871086 RepID=UPI002733DAC2|nr:CHAT domain-containing protein [Brevundimonas sp.]MDP3657554.1 CHAT domain-containing protein [Brevundimonas sp.]MDZ4112225.1 CHAT domain-containing protein [Brevundimonas sp.]
MTIARIARCLASVVALAAVFAANPAPAGQESHAALRAEAYEAAQWAIASDAADALARVSARFAQGDDALGRLAEERESLIGRRDRLERELERLYASDDAGALADRARVRTAWEGTVERLRAVDADIEARFPAYSELTSPRALSLAETQALLGPDEGLLLVLVNPEATYVWGLSRDRVEWARAETLGDAAMTEAVKQLRASLTSVGGVRGQAVDPILFAGPQATPFDRATAHRLYTELVRPVEAAFDGKTTLISVVTGALTALPLSVLTTSAPTGSDAAPEALAPTPWLIDRYALATLPSVSSLEALRCHLVADPALRSPGCPPRRGGVARRDRPEGAPLHLVAFGAPLLTGEPRDATRDAPAADDVMGDGRLADVGKLRALPSLPGSKLELETLKTRYPDALVRIGREATERAVRADDADALSRARFVVFSTHGLMAGSAAAEPGLVMTPPDQASEADDGYLSASEAAQLRLDAEFVVLSACNTAASDGRPGGEGLSGLARAFFYAGARSVMVSHWEVSDAATTTLITSAFADLDDNRAGDPGVRARALQAGIRAVRAERRWAHPAYWAAFTLVGEPG